MQQLLTNSSFEYLREFKTVEPATEELVSRKLNKRYSQEILLSIFEKGISGEYGKVVNIEPQTIFSWVKQYEAAKNNGVNYLETPLLDPYVRIDSNSYPTKDEEWRREADKCFNAFLNGVSAQNFHSHIYDRMMLDGKIQLNAYKQHFKNTGNEELDLMTAKQRLLHVVFSDYKNKGYTTAYLIK